MKLSYVERASLANQFRILEKLSTVEFEQKDYSYKAEIFEEGYERLYEDALNTIGKTAHSEEEGQELFDILNMYRHIHISLKSLSASETAQINMGNTEFEGLDGNNDREYGFLIFVVENGRYSELDRNNLNSHTTASLPKYREMLSLYNTFSGTNSYKPLPFSEVKHLTDIN